MILTLVTRIIKFLCFLLPHLILLIIYWFPFPLIQHALDLYDDFLSYPTSFYLIPLDLILPCFLLSYIASSHPISLTLYHYLLSCSLLILSQYLFCLFIKIFIDHNFFVNFCTVFYAKILYLHMSLISLTGFYVL